VLRRAVEKKLVTRRQRWALPGLILLPLLFVGCLVLLGPVLVGMAPVFAGLASVGALVILTLAVHEWTRSVLLAALLAAASVFVSVLGMVCLLFWAATHATFG
jgi:hypothetical protein